HICQIEHEFITPFKSGSRPGFEGPSSVDLDARLQQLENKFKYSFTPESYGSWVVVSLVLASFAPVINADRSQPFLATFLAIVGLAFLIWATPMFFVTRWPIYNRAMMIAL